MSFTTGFLHSYIFHSNEANVPSKSLRSGDLDFLIEQYIKLIIKMKHLVLDATIS